MKQYLTKKKILIFIVILLPVLFVLPMRCSNIVTRMEFIGDTGTPRASRTCYSVYHKNFWTIMRERPIEYMFGAVPLAGWLEYESDGLPVNDGIYPYRRVETRIFHHTYPADYSDNTILMGASQNVFIGKVVAQVSNKDFIGSPATQFSVEIIRNIKGDARGTVVINQEGGFRDGILYLAEEGGKMLQPGSTYLLATRYDSEGGYYTLNPHPNASKLLSTDARLDNIQLRTFVDQDIKVKSLESAYAHEVLLDADIAHGNTRNSFQSLPPAEKATTQSRADAARASLEAMQ